MKLRQVLLLALVPLALGACKKKAPEAAPVPAATDDAAAREAARADSIAAFEAAEREARERARAAELARVRESLTDMIFYDFDSDQLTTEAQDRLRDKATILRANQDVELRIEGHADERGSTEYNLALGQRRAEAVRAFLGGYGVDAGRLSTISYGKERPLIDGAGESAWAQNRRAEFAITAGDVSVVPNASR